jgi:histone acetyltransferase (RNA polymerase elongator complex component)
MDDVVIEARIQQVAKLRELADEMTSERVYSEEEGRIATHMRQAANELEGLGSLAIEYAAFKDDEKSEFFHRLERALLDVIRDFVRSETDYEARISTVITDHDPMHVCEFQVRGECAPLTITLDVTALRNDRRLDA